MPQSKAFLAKQPLPLILLISEELQKFLVGVFLSLFSKLSLVLIGFKPCSKGGAVISTLLKDSSKIAIWVKHYHVVIFKMNLEANNVWDLFMSVEVKESPDRIRCRDVLAINPVLDLIFLPKFQSTPVRSFMNIFKGIHESSKGDCTFHVNVAVEISTEKRGERDNPAVIDQLSIDLISSSIIWSKIIMDTHDGPLS